jgi:hypothetical protein
VACRLNRLALVFPPSYGIISKVIIQTSEVLAEDSGWLKQEYEAKVSRRHTYHRNLGGLFHHFVQLPYYL